MSQEALLWKIALEHFGPTDLLCTIVELWSLAGPPARLTVEHLGDEVLGEEVMSILKIAQIQVGAIVPGREANSAKITLYCRHASHLADGLLQRIPGAKLPRCLRGVRLEGALGM
jgi:hypothetical protein